MGPNAVLLPIGKLKAQKQKQTKMHL